MHIKKIIPLIIVILLCNACERTLDFVAANDESMSDVSISALAVTGVPLTVYLNQANAVDEAQTIIFAGSDPTRYLNEGNKVDYWQDDYFRQTTIMGAQVIAEVNGSQTYILTFDKERYAYVGSYIPQEGDCFVVRATANNTEVSAKTDVPQKAVIEIVTHEVIPDNPYRMVNGYGFNTDTIMRITCRISAHQEKQYYRLRVRSERDAYISRSTKLNDYQMQDIYFSDDDLFVDRRLTTNFGGWQPYFSNVFDDTLMNGDSYTFTVYSPKMPWIIDGAMTSQATWENPPLKPRVMVELQTISYDLYRYLKSVQLYRITESDEYAEPVQIYGNVQNGWGILGALSYDRHFVEFEE